mgnify:CR=1 FL=1
MASGRACGRHGWVVMVCARAGVVAVVVLVSVAGRQILNVPSTHDMRATSVGVLWMLPSPGIPCSSFGRGGHNDGAACAGRAALCTALPNVGGA